MIKGRSPADVGICGGLHVANQTEILGNVWPCGKKILDARDRRARSGFNKLAGEKDYIYGRLRSVPASFGDRSMIIRKSKAQLDEELNEALKETFPGSDPVAIDASTDKPIRPIGRRPPGIDKALVEDLAREVRKSHARSRPH